MQPQPISPASLFARVLRRTGGLLGALLLMMGGSLAAEAGGQNSPAEVYEVFCKALLAKDAAAAVAVMHGDAEEKKFFTEQVGKLPADLLAALKTAALLETKTDGDFGVGITSMTRNGSTVFESQYFIREGGKWLVLETTLPIPREKLEPMQEWFMTRKAALEKAAPAK